MNKMIIMLSTALLLDAVGYAHPRMKNSNQCSPECQFEQGLELPDNKYCPGYNAPAYIDVCGWNLDVGASFTYWNVNQELMDVAFVGTISSPIAADVINGKVVIIEDTWKPGFKINIACNTNYDGWVGSAEYTWVRSSTSISASNNTGNTGLNYVATSLLPYYIQSGIQELSSNWKMHLDLLDVLFSRPYYEGTRITATPFAGLRALWIRQQQSADYNEPGSGILSISTKSKCWSIGPTTGISGHWLLGQGFRFEGSTAASLLYTQYTNISFNFVNPGDLPSPGKMTNVDVLRPTAEFGIGMGWGSYIFCQNYFIDFSARYDFKYFWSQNMERWLTSATGGYQGNEIGALMLHGLTLSGSFDF